jgi:hypothetical protein
VDEAMLQQGATQLDAFHKAQAAAAKRAAKKVASIHERRMVAKS